MTIEEKGRLLSSALKPQLPELEDLELKFQFQRKSQKKATKGSAPAEKYFHPEPGDELVFRVVRRPPESASAAAAPPAPPTSEPAQPVSSEVACLLRTLNELESDPTRGFVALKRFRDEWLPARGLSPEAARRALSESIHSGSVRITKLVNPHSPFPTSTLSLNRDHPDVRAALSSTPAARKLFTPLDLGGLKVSDVILANRR